MILIDSNIPMYLVGTDHPNKMLARGLVTRAVRDGDSLVTDAEVLQEILHRYLVTDRRHLVEEAMIALLDVVDEVFPIERSDVERARDIALARRLSARDSIHVAVMRRRGIDRIMTFDRGFDQVEGITRIAD